MDEKGNQTATVVLDPEYCMKNTVEYKYITRQQVTMQSPSLDNTPTRSVSRVMTNWEAGENRKLDGILRGTICWCFGSARICVVDNDVIMMN